MALDVQYFRTAVRRGALHRRAHFGSRIYRDLQFFPALEKYLKQRSNHFELHLELRNKNDLQAFMTTLRELGMRIDDVELNSAFINSGLSVYAIKLTIESKELKKYKTHDEIIEALRSIDYIHYIEEK